MRISEWLLLRPLTPRNVAWLSVERIGVIPNARRTELARWMWFCCGCGCVGDGARELAFELDVVERPNGTLLGGAIA